MSNRAIFIGNSGKWFQKCDFRKGTRMGMEAILLVLWALTGSITGRSFASNEAFSLEKEELVSDLQARRTAEQCFAPPAQLEISGEPEIDVKRFGPVWASFYGGPVDYSPDGNQIVVGGPGVIFVLNAKTYEIERQLFGHSDLVSSVKWSPDGSYIASGAFDKTVKIWEAATGDLIRTLEGHTQRVTSVAWSPDGESLASAAHPGGVILWKVQTGEIRRQLAGINSVSWSPDGSHVVVGYTDAVGIYEVETGELVRVLRRHGSIVQAVAWSPDGQYIASGGSAPFDMTVKIWEVETERLIITLEGGDPESLAWSPDGAYLACGCWVLRVWKTETWEPVRIVSQGSPFPMSVSWHPEGKYLVSGGGKVLNIWDIESGTAVMSMGGHRNQVTAIAWSPEGRFLASGSSSFPLLDTDMSIKIWDTETGNIIRTIREDSVCRAVEFLERSPNGKYLASSNRCSTVRIWDVETGTEFRRFTGRSLTWSSDSKYLATSPLVSSFGPRVINIWEIESGDLIREIDTPKSVAYVSWSPDGRYLAAALYPDPVLEVWEVETWKLLRTFEGRNRLSHLTWSPDSKFLASSDGSDLGSIHLINIWEIEAGKLVRTFDVRLLINSLSWSPKGQYMALSGRTGLGEDKIEILEVEAGNLMVTLRGHADVIPSVRWSPDGRYLASGSWDSTVRLWGERAEE